MSLTLMYIIYKTNRLLEKMVIFRIDTNVQNGCLVERNRVVGVCMDSPIQPTKWLSEIFKKKRLF